MPERKGILPYCATLALLISLVFVLRRIGQRAELEKIIQRKVLPNGLEVIVVENHGVPLATVEVNVKNGSFTQSARVRRAGAHVRAHVLQGELQVLASPGQFVDRMSDLGAVFNGTTQEERVNYYLTVPAEKVGDAIGLLGDRAA